MKVKTIKLKNKVRLVLSSDENKNQTDVKLIVHYGSIIRNVNIDGNDEVIPAGLAHLLEHTIVENSIYGNSIEYFKQDYAKFNAFTSKFKTEFVLNTIVNFYDHLRELINIVNNPIFDEKLLTEVKKPVIEEIKRGEDRPYEKFNKEYSKILFSSEKNLDGLGKQNEVSNISAEYLKLIHSSFYTFENQTIYIAGNFNIDKVIEVIEDAYSKLNKDKHKVVILDKEEQVKLYKDEVHVIDKEFDPLVSLIFKIDISKFTAKEKVKLSFYINHFLRYNFNYNSKLNKKLKDKKKTVFDLNFSDDYRTFKDYVIVSIEMYGTDYKYFKDNVLDTLKEIQYDEEKFYLWKKHTILDLILRADSCFKIGLPFLDNIETYNYLKLDTVKDIEDFTLEDYLNYMKSLKFDNYSLIYETKE